MSEYKCKLCEGKEFYKFKGLAAHMFKRHKVVRRQFYVDYYLNGNWPLCACGCGEKTKWSYIDKKFREFSGVGHLNRVRNNWGHNKSAIDKSSVTRRQQYKNGEREPWCKGLTKETDDRLKKFGEKISIAFTDDRKKKYSKMLSENRKNGTTPTLYREKSSQWKGGVSSINQMARGDKRFYDLWKYPILIRDVFKCTECQNTQDLHIHHNKDSFSDIIKKVMTLEDYEKVDDFEVKKKVVDKVLEYHLKENVSGITLCKECHNDIHHSLNF